MRRKRKRAAPMLSDFVESIAQKEEAVKL